MMDTKVGFLHPGAMGSILASCCLAPTRLWLSEGRSAATAERASASGLVPVDTLEEMIGQADLIVSICPPAASTDVAQSVADAGFSGVFVDANAISPERSRRNAELFEDYVDASVIGPPPTRPGLARLYVSGALQSTSVVEQLWAGSDLEVRSVGTEIGAASALKMAYAGWTKGSAALLMAIAALAEAEGVSEALQTEWGISQPDLPSRLTTSASGSAPKAWRFVGEMEEIASSMANVGLPAEFHQAAADLFQRLAGLKNSDPNTETVLNELLD